MKGTSRGPTARMFRPSGLAVVFVAASAFLVLPATQASAHEVREVGDLTFVDGWASEPAYAGFGNEVQVIVTETRGERPVEDGDLQAEVTFGEPGAGVTSDALTLDPAFDAPNEYLGYIIPTRPGTYSFHVTGSVGGQDIDETFTSGPQTFDDVNNPTTAEFPEQDPTRGELAGALDRLTGRIDDLRAEVTAESGDPVAMWIAIGAGVLALIALGLAARRRAG